MLRVHSERRRERLDFVVMRRPTNGFKEVLTI
jgi:hypothetical protein